METLEEHNFTSSLLEKHPGYEKLVSELCTLLPIYSPPFIYINDPMTVRITSEVVNSVLGALSPPICFAHVNGVACFTPRLLYDSVLNSLADWHPKWEDGCQNWSVDGDAIRWNESVDGFLHGLRALNAFKSKMSEEEAGVDGSLDQVRMVLVVDRPERLKETLPDLIVPLTRLAELVRCRCGSPHGISLTSALR